MVQRRNWFILDDSAYFFDEKMQNRGIIDAGEVATLWIRSERQTLRRLSETGAIIFTVKTQFAPFPELRGRSDVAARLVDFLKQASPRSLANKDAAGRVGAIIDYLDR